MKGNFLFSLTIVFLFSACIHGSVTNYEYWELKLSQEKGQINGGLVKEALLRNHFFKEDKGSKKNVSGTYIHSKYKSQKIIIFKQQQKIFIGAVLFKPAFYQSRDPKSVFRDIINKASKLDEVFISEIYIKENIKPQYRPRWAPPNEPTRQPTAMAMPSH